jgi:hypothetical protein
MPKAMPRPTLLILKPMPSPAPAPITRATPIRFAVEARVFCFWDTVYPSSSLCRPGRQSGPLGSYGVIGPGRYAPARCRSWPNLTIQRPI